MSVAEALACWVMSSSAWQYKQTPSWKVCSFNAQQMFNGDFEDVKMLIHFLSHSLSNTIISSSPTDESPMQPREHAEGFAEEIFSDVTCFYMLFTFIRPQVCLRGPYSRQAVTLTAERGEAMQHKHEMVYRRGQFSCRESYASHFLGLQYFLSQDATPVVWVPRDMVHVVGFEISANRPHLCRVVHPCPVYTSYISLFHDAEAVGDGRMMKAAQFVWTRTTRDVLSFSFSRTRSGSCHDGQRVESSAAGCVGSLITWTGRTHRCTTTWSSIIQAS